MSTFSPSEDQEFDEADAEAMRPTIANVRVEVEVFDAVREQSAFPVQPVRLTPEDTFAFNCRRDLECWNRCCHGADITLTPQCILRLSRHLKLAPSEFLLRHTVPAINDKADLPVAKMRSAGEDGRGACPFSTEDGCSVYDARPATCRYYPLGMVTMKMKDMETRDDFFFLVKENHCLGHCEAKTQNVGEFRGEQGVADYDRVNRGWLDILMKMASWKVLGGPMGKSPSPQTKKMFFMATTDVKALRRFVLGTKFLEVYDIAPEAVEIIKTDDEALLLLGQDWMKNVLFNEPTIALKEQVLQAAIGKAREDIGAA